MLILYKYLLLKLGFELLIFIKKYQMKTPEFFISQAKQLSQKSILLLEEEPILKDDYYSNSPSFLSDKSSGKEFDPLENVRSLYFEIELMINEFDKNLPFTKKIAEIGNENYLFEEKKRFLKYKSLLDNFISHIEVWRIEQ